MKPAELLRELAFPLTQPALSLAMLFFWIVLGFAKFAGLFGLFLLFLAAPAYLRYLVTVLDDRAHGRGPEPPTVEMFNLTDNAWTLFPAIPIALLIWANFAVSSLALEPGALATTLALLPELVFLLLMPAFLAVLSMTHSPVASLNPLTIAAVIRRSMPLYLLVPLALLPVALVLDALRNAGVPSFLLDLGASYSLFLFCSLTGFVLFRSGLYLEVDIPDPIEPDREAVDAKLLAARKDVATHAYGFVSRGNRDGGLRHIQQRIDEEADVDGAYQWFFEEMLRWQSNDAVLYFAQTYLSRLLRIDQDAAAIRVLMRCLHRNPAFRPLEQDRQLLIDMLQKRGRSDLVTMLQG
ncbi:MAG: hypothetical protein RLN69_12560 [Woeseiaceae bacterium]